jgi:hypothetical protein
MKHKDKKDILIIIVLLLIFVLTWIGGSIYHSALSSTISEEINQNISPISPVFDVKTIDKLKERQKINPSFELGNITPTPAILPITEIPPQNASGEGKILL